MHFKIRIFFPLVHIAKFCCKTFVESSSSNCILGTFTRGHSSSWIHWQDVPTFQLVQRTPSHDTRQWRPWHCIYLQVCKYLCEKKIKQVYCCFALAYYISDFNSGFTIKKSSLHKKVYAYVPHQTHPEAVPHNYTHTNLSTAVIIEQFGCKLTKLNVHPLKIQYMISVSILESNGLSYRYF